MLEKIEGLSLNELVVDGLKTLLNKGVKEESRAGSTTYLQDVELILHNPRARNLHLNGRTNNIFATWAEIFWVFSGETELDPVMNFFLPRAVNYSDDGKHWRAGYGHRLYQHCQIQSILDAFERDSRTRQAVFSIWQPEFDTKESIKKVYNLDSTKDTPCSNFGWFFVDDENKFNMKFAEK